MSEPPSTYSESRPKARKEHRCCECRGTISLGETYQLFNGCWDGSWTTYKTCVDCLDLRAKIDAGLDRYDDPPPFGQLYETVFESRDGGDLIRCFMDTRRKRGSPESPNGWMERAEAELNESKP